MVKKLNLKKAFLYASGAIIVLGGSQAVQANDNCLQTETTANKHNKTPEAYIKKLSDSFNLLNELPLGRQLYKIAKQDNIAICSADDDATKIKASAFLKSTTPPYIGYSNSMIERSPAAVATTMAHEFQHYQQHKYANRFLWSRKSDSLQDKLLSQLISEATTRTTSTLIAYQLKQRHPNIKLDNQIIRDINLFSSFVKEHKHLPTKQAEFTAARYMMQEMLTKENNFTEWRQYYIKSLYNNSSAPEKERYANTIKQLKKSLDTQHSITNLSKLAKLPNGQNIMPFVISTTKILNTVRKTAENALKDIQKWEKTQWEKPQWK